MKYYYDSTMLGTNKDNATVFVRTNNNFFDCERYDVGTKKWVLDREYSSKVFEGQVEYEEITEAQADEFIKRLGELS